MHRRLTIDDRFIAIRNSDRIDLAAPVVDDGQHDPCSGQGAEGEPAGRPGIDRDSRAAIAAVPAFQPFVTAAREDVNDLSEAERDADQPAMPDPCLRALARCRDIAAHQIRAFVGGVMEWIVKVRVETRKARADIAAWPRVRSCNSPPKPITLAELLPLNLGKRAALHGRHETRP